jgi:hypothetical protein
MRKFIVIVALMVCFMFPVRGQKTRLGQIPEKHNLADYSSDVHISSTHIRYYCSGFRDQISCSNGLFADVIVNGKKLELSGATTIGKHEFVLLIPGDYKARLTKNVSDQNGAVIKQEFDVLMSDGTTWHCVTTGISE